MAKLVMCSSQTLENEDALQEIYAKLEGNNALLIQAPGKPQLAVLPVKTLHEIAVAEETSFVDASKS